MVIFVGNDGVYLFIVGGLSIIEYVFFVGVMIYFIGVELIGSGIVNGEEVIV